MATTTAPPVRSTQATEKWRAPAAVLLVVLLAVAAFAVAYLVTHKSRASPAPAKIVKAKITPGPSAAQVKSEFTGTVGALHVPKPKPKPKPKKQAATAPAVTPSTSVTPVETTPVETTPAYTPPVVTPSSGGNSSGTGSSGTTHKHDFGGGTITVG